MNDTEQLQLEILVKSSERVKDLGEVFTPNNIVGEMLALLPDDTWQTHPSRTFLEPAAGNGNFVSAVLARKLEIVRASFVEGLLPAGTEQEAATFHALESLSSIYGVDISEDNIIGGTLGHEIACRPRLLQLFTEWHSSLTGKTLGSDSDEFLAAKWIVEHNMIVGNMLPSSSDFPSTGRDNLVLIEYVWSPSNKSVQLLRTTMGAAIELARFEKSGALNIFAPSQAEKFWEGPALQLNQAENHANLTLTGRKISNSRGSKS
jgi:hypothetical protein